MFKEDFLFSQESNLAKQLYDIRDVQKAYGRYHKSLLHFHTPASHDYNVIISGIKKSFTELEEEDLINLAAEKNSICRFEKLNMDYLRNMVNKNILFTSLKELIAYLLIANVLILKNIEYAIITDHNTIEGFKKLKCAISIIKRSYKSDNVPNIVLQIGVEITCGDSNHVVVIGRNTSTSQQQITSFLETTLLDKKFGTYKPSWEVIEHFNSLGYIAYIAHINSSNIFKEGFGNHAYRRRLISQENMGVVGVSDVRKKEGLLSKLESEPWKLTNVVVLYDEDSHNLKDLGEKTFWLKGQELNFDMLRNAIEDADISISYDKPSGPNISIKNVFIEGKGFLGKGSEPFNLSFSTALNCIIGGRGSGKSTLLNSIGFVLSQRIEGISQLKNICAQGKIYVTIEAFSQLYFLKFAPAVDNVFDENFLSGFLYGSEHQFHYKNLHNRVINSDDFVKKVRGKIQIFTIRGSEVYEVRDKNKFFKKVFRSTYSINQLVKSASDNKIDNFIEMQLNSSQMPLPKYKNYNIKDDEELKKAFNNIEEKMQNHKKRVEKSISKFDELKNIKIEYKQDTIDSMRFDWESEIEERDLIKDKWFYDYNLTKAGIISFCEEGSAEEGLISFYLSFRDKAWDDPSEILFNSTEEIDNKLLGRGVQVVNSNNINKVLNKIGDKIINPLRYEIYKLAKTFYANSDSFDLLFNINNDESKDKPPIFKSIADLSLGQKVVALLDFIFSFGEISHDSTPLLLDQPEDNLDSIYIHKHLVQALRKQKDKRQVIIVTHNSTIVTNSKPEQIISMKSNNINGWVENSGYPTNKKAVLSVINLLEGGIASFKHKQFVYQPILDENSQK